MPGLILLLISGGLTLRSLSNTEWVNNESTCLPTLNENEPLSFD